MEESTLRWPIDKEREEMEEVCSAYLFSTEKATPRNRKVRDNSANDSRYNRCNVYHNTMLTKALLT